ncbi:hypothetical protein B0H14DRAFT_2645516 [Mycena olivaceomarginata]|nr:hypothetical protein B0H14DRAFT_2645516 [Mycena olivaceomarginata]
MKNAPWAFDLADLAPALLLFGHMGPTIASNWQEIYSKEAHQAQAAIPAEMKNMQCKLPEHLTPIQILMFKPVTEMTSDELSLFTAEYGSATNPVALLGDLPLLTDEEVEEDEDAEPEPEPEPDAAHVKPGFTIILDPLFEQEEGSDDGEDQPLTLIRDKSRAKMQTRLCKSHAKNGFFCWTVLKPPYTTVVLNPYHKPTNALVFSQIMNRVRKKRTLRAIKATMKLYTVGPMDFCGHAKAVRRGSTWRKGIRKGRKEVIAKEINFRTKILNLLQKNWKLSREITDEDVRREVYRQKKEKRDKALKAAEAKKAQAHKKGKKGKKGK